MPTAHLLLYLVDFSTALSTQSSSSSIVFGKRTFLRPLQKQFVNHFKYITLLEYKFGATRNYWIIKNKTHKYNDCWLNTKKLHIQGILKKNWKNTTLHNFIMFLWRSRFKNSGFGFHQVSKHEKTIKPRDLRPRGLKWFLALGNLMKPEARVFEIVLVTHQAQKILFGMLS